MSKHTEAVAAAGRASGNPHVRSNDLNDGGGWGTGKAPADTASYNPTGNQAGAPYRSRKMNDDDQKTMGPYTDNPYNQHDTDEKQVIGRIFDTVVPQRDSPVPAGVAMPDRFGNYKADAVASVTEATPAGMPVSFPADGVLGRS